MTVLMVISLPPLLDGLSNIGTVDFRRQMQFQKEFAIMVVPKFFGIIATLTGLELGDDARSQSSCISRSRGGGRAYIDGADHPLPASRPRRAAAKESTRRRESRVS